MAISTARPALLQIENECHLNRSPLGAGEAHLNWQRSPTGKKAHRKSCYDATKRWRARKAAQALPKVDG